MTAGARVLSLCPSCDRFIGPASACPYCGTPGYRRELLRTLRGAALALALAGLAGLLAWARGTDTPLVTVREIGPTYHFARVRLAGTITATPRSGKTRYGTDYVAFTLDDGTGRIRVVAYDTPARELIEDRAIPAAGAHVTVAGSLDVSHAEPPQLRIQSAGQLRAEGEP